jgi:hypothetical protein
MKLKAAEEWVPKKKKRRYRREANRGKALLGPGPAA